MSLTVLFDLDDTLLHTNMDGFLPEYFKLLSNALSNLGPQKQITKQIYEAVQQMAANQDPGKMLDQIFAENFYQPLGTTESDCSDVLTAFYEQEFPSLRSLTIPKPEASALVNWCLSQDMTIAVATNPLFPQSATRQRIEWAGLNPADFVFYSTFNDFHFTKPNLSYYAEAMGRLGWPKFPAVMVGDNLTYDLLPGEALGLDTFWVSPPVNDAERPQGQLSDVKPLLEDLMHKERFQLSHDPQVQIAILRSTPAVVDTWLKRLPQETMTQKPSKNEWGFVEVLWHVADFEKEIYLPQWEQLLLDPSVTLTQANTSNWATERNYQTRDPQQAFNRFLEARQASLSMLETLWDKGLFEVTVSHTIFSETKIGELVAFSAKHDRLHLNQCVNLINL